MFASWTLTPSKKKFYWVYQEETAKVLFSGGLVWLVAEDSATIEDRDLVRRQAGILARRLQHPADLQTI